MKNVNLIFLGAPGSGKGTQSSKFVSSCDYKHVSTGDLLRNEINKKSELGLEVQKVMDMGNLVSDDLVVKLLKSNLDLENRLYIFDGYPRNLNQAKTLDNEVLGGKPSLAIYFKIDPSKLIERLTNRRTCKNCGTIYNLISKPPKINGVCDKCGSSDLKQRDDDKKEVISNRLNVFENTIGPVIQYYQDLNRLIEVDAQDSEADIFNKIRSKI